MRWLGSRPLHFVALGAALFAIERLALPPRAERAIVTVPAWRLAQLRADSARGTATPPADEEALVERAVEEEILYREALARGLDRDDQSIRWRLAEKMRFLAGGDDETERGIDPELYREAVDLGLDQQDLFVRGLLVRKMRLLLERGADESPPTDTELRGYFERHADRYREPARVSFWHVFLSRDRRGSALEGDASRLLDRLRARATPALDAVRLGDPLPSGAHLRAQSARELTRLFGVEFSRAVLALEPASWAGPLASPYGLHLVHVEEQLAAQPPPFEAMRSRVLAELREERRQARLAESLRALRAKYLVRVERATEERG